MEDTPVNRELSELASSRGEKLLVVAIGSYKPGRACDYRSMQLLCGHTQDVRVTHYRKSTYLCKVCFEQEFHDVAASQGLVLKSMNIVRHGSEREYIRPCGHIEVHSLAYLKKHKIQPCQICLTATAKNNLEDKGFQLISNTREGYNIQCNECEHHFHISASCGREGTPFCENCFEKRLGTDAAHHGFKYRKDLEPLRKGTTTRVTIYRMYECTTCGHVDSFGHIAMSMGIARCSKCYLDRLQSDAEKQGMTYVGFHGKSLHKYILSCGCEKKINPYHVKRGIWACREHDNTHFHRDNGVYLVKLEYNGFSWLKFGLAKDMGVRIKGYGLNKGTKAEILFYFPLPTRYDAMDIEVAIHNELSLDKLDKVFMQSFMKKGGHTECYPVSMEDRITEMVKERYTMKLKQLENDTEGGGGKNVQ